VSWKLAANDSSREFQLTRAQEIQRQREGYLALEMRNARCFDFGVPDDFAASLKAFRNQ
jgi:UTP--glucose-1-phosphate uridylyltransferase